MLEIKLAKNKMEHEEGMNHLWLEVTPEEATGKVEKPIAFLLVLDVSGSMNGSMQTKQHVPFDLSNQNWEMPTERSTKLDYVKQAAERLVDTMKDGDMLGVVSFADTARLEYPLSELTKPIRFELKDRIRALQTRGMTNVSDGLEMAYRQIPEQLKKTHHIKLLLLSDGQANYGITDVDGMGTLVQGYRKQDVSVSTIGVGADYNSYFMETIATVSGGMFYHLKEMTQLQTIFTSELEKLTTLTTKQATLRIELPSGIHAEENLNGFEEKQKGHIFLGNVFSPQTILTEIFTKEEIAIGERVIRVTLTYTNALGEPKVVQQSIPLTIVKEDDLDDVQTDAKVVEWVKKMMEAKTKKEALRAYENGNIGLLNSAMRQTKGKLVKMEAQYGMETTDTLDSLTNLHESMQQFSLDKNEMKTMYARSFNATRSIEEEK